MSSWENSIKLNGLSKSNYISNYMAEKKYHSKTTFLYIYIYPLLLSELREPHQLENVMIVFIKETPPTIVVWNIQ